tara:strand:+ start:287 stop:457 length:171 start_codon:yes stop_codon:yes gene_type:complete
MSKKIGGQLISEHVSITDSITPHQELYAKIKKEKKKIPARISIGTSSTRYKAKNCE